MTHFLLEKGLEKWFSIEVIIRTFLQVNIRFFFFLIFHPINNVLHAFNGKWLRKIVCDFLF